MKTYLELTKPRILVMILVTTALGYYMGAQGIDSWLRFIITLVGTGLTSGGAAALNCYVERDIDSQMHRTKNRALPLGKIEPGRALLLGLSLVVGGTVLLCWQVNLLTGLLALMTAFLYVVIYTPLKQYTWLNTFVGAIPGAIPPLGGWAAATGELSFPAWILFLILFLWQHPHFYAIAWMYKDDYKRGGLQMLPVVQPDGLSTFRQVIVYGALLIPISLLPTVIGLSGAIYFWGALAAGIWFLSAGVRLGLYRGVQDARKVLRVSIIYLPLLLLLIVLDRGF